jgi:putative endonuclease
MFIVYVLYSQTFDKIYVGYTSNLEQRFKSHNELAKKGWTVRFRPWSILFTEQFSSKELASAREKQLKSAKGRLYIRQQIGQSKI